MNEYYSVIIFFCIFALGIMEIGLIHNTVLDYRNRKLFSILYGLIIVASLCEWGSTMLDGTNETWISLHIFLKTIELAIAPFIGAIAAEILNSSKYFHWMLIVMCMNSLFELYSAFQGTIFAINEKNIYLHGTYYWMYILFYMIGAVYFLFQSIGAMKKYQHKGSLFIAGMVSFLMVGLGIQLIYSKIKVDWFVLTIVTILLYQFYCDMVQQTDSLTMLLNRRGYENYIMHQKKGITILFFDVDCFKKINDTYGHPFGDFCLQKIAEVIRKTYALSGKCFRIGGDEFAVILEKNRESVENYNTNFFLRLSEKREKESRLPHVSVGYVHFDPNNNNLQDALKDADKMMYQYKQKRKMENREHMERRKIR